jgi:hypothetical protein
MARPEITGKKTGTAPDELVPDPEFARELNITLMTLWRWDRDPELSKHIPPRMKIRNRNYRSRNGIETFKVWLLHHAVAARGGKAA